MERELCGEFKPSLNEISPSEITATGRHDRRFLLKPDNKLKFEPSEDRIYKQTNTIVLKKIENEYKNIKIKNILKKFTNEKIH